MPATYGLKTYNGSDEVILDSNEGFSTFIKVADGTVSPSPGAFNFPSGTAYTDLLFVRPTISGFISENVEVGGGRKLYSSSGGTIEWLKADVTTSNVSNWNSGYGLNVFDGTGAPSASRLLFSSNASTAFSVVSVGSYAGLGAGETTLTVDIIDPSLPHYVLIPGSFKMGWTFYAAWPVTDDIVIEYKKGYHFNYDANGVLTTIDIHSNYISPNGTLAPFQFGGAGYMIVKLRS